MLLGFVVAIKKSSNNLTKQRERELYWMKNSFIFFTCFTMVSNSKEFQSLDEKKLEDAYNALVALVVDLSEDQKNVILQRLYSDV